MRADEERLGPERERRLLLAEEDARRVLLVRAVEEADPRGELLPAPERERASAAARAEAPDEDELGAFAAARARRLAPLVAERGGPGERLLAASGLGLRPGRIALVALVLGLATNLLGPERGIHVLANPITALLAWNALVYLLLAVEAARHVARARRGAESGGAPLAALAVALAARRLRRVTAGAETGARATRVAAATGRYFDHWRRAGGALLAARARRALHLGAAVLVLGALAGTYARGLLFEYRVVWESTFLDAGTVDALLRVLLGPASALSGIEVPSVATFYTDRPGPAAPWIHLLAITAGLVVLAPRLVLAALAGSRARRLARAVALDADDAYFRRLSAALRGKGVEVDVLPYSYALAPRRADALRRLLHDAVGARARITLREPLPYGEDVPPTADEHDVRVLVFNLAQTPEAEVHARAAAEAAAGGRAVAIVDAAAWRERTAGSAAIEERVGEHRRTWERMLRGAGLAVVHVDLDRPAEDGLVERVEDALAGRAGVEAGA